MFDFFSLHGMKMEKKVLFFIEEGIIKDKFDIYEESINIDKVDIKRIILSDIESYGSKDTFKYFIGYK